MSLQRINQYEQAIVNILRLDGWDLEWCGGGFDHYDAKGYTPKGKECVIEMKFRNKYYETKMLEKYKYDKMMEMPNDIIKLYFVNDPKANYMFWLNDIVLAEPIELNCPSTTLWDQEKKPKLVYLLEESQASIINQNDTDDTDIPSGFRKGNSSRTDSAKGDTKKVS